MPDRKKIYLCINIYSLILQKHEKVYLFSYCNGRVGHGSLYRWKQSRIRCHRYSRGASDGDTVYLQEANGRNLVKLDTAVITKGTFTFVGTQDSVVSRYITCEVDGEPLMIDFFLFITQRTVTH